MRLGRFWPASGGWVRLGVLGFVWVRQANDVQGTRVGFRSVPLREGHTWGAMALPCVLLRRGTQSPGASLSISSTTTCKISALKTDLPLHTLQPMKRCCHAQLRQQLLLLPQQVQQVWDAQAHDGKGGCRSSRGRRGGSGGPRQGRGRPSGPPWPLPSWGLGLLLVRQHELGEARTVQHVQHAQTRCVRRRPWLGKASFGTEA